ncbi:MAG: hypothetical protein EP298_06555 [Gammaproteobacteria bacterium]|nr:MAG: hypothetical protein EP298_06555 [Gammaproteobacteria bacterium]UTW43303.1 hypothetical protein KFE69_03980 [bacterium SCSIO 12844]
MTDHNKPIIYLDPASICARSALKKTDIQITSNINDASLLWLRKGYRNYYQKLKAFQYLNHFPGENNFSNKGKLTENLKLYNHLNSSTLKLSDFYQESYCLYKETEIDTFFSQMPKSDNKQNLWILKPNNLSKGRGIKILWQINDLKSLLSSQSNYTLQFDDQKPCQYIAQRYIKNPLLLNNRKSEIRIYWLIISLEPLIALIYPHGTVRLNSVAFQLAYFDNPLIHITNIYQQKKYNKETKNLRLKWSFDELDQYLLHNQITQQKCFSQEVLLPQIKQVLLYVIQATRHKLNHKTYKGSYFGLYGADFILDSHLKPWLTEIQKGPGLSWSDPIKGNIIPPALHETIQIISELSYKKRLNQNLNRLNSIQHFQYLINEADH